MKKWLPWTIVMVFAIWVLGSLRIPPDKDWSYQQFGRLPVIANGRIQPMDSLARNALLQLREKQTANLEPWKSWYEKPEIIPAVEWVLAVMMKPDEADAWPVFRIDNPDVRGLLKLPGEPDELKKQDGKHYSWLQIKPGLADLERETERANKVESAARRPYEQALIKLWSAQTVYNSLKDALGPANRGDLTADLPPYLVKYQAGSEAYVAARNKDNGTNYDQAALDWIFRQYEAPLLMAGGQGGFHDQWMRAVEAVTNQVETGTPHFSLLAYNDISRAYRANDAAGFNQAVVAYQNQLAEHLFTRQLTKARHEQFFDQIEPFYKAMILYVCAFLFVLGYWFKPGEWDWMRLTAVGLALLALAVHTSGLLFRMFLEGRPPVTNLYSSAIFIGWGATVLGLVLERFWRNSIGVMVSCMIGFTTLLIAHNLSLAGDTMEMMRAVLDTNFWLATHVVVVTLGYSSTFVAGFLGVIYVLMGVFTKRLSAVMSPDKATGMGLVTGAMAGGVVGAAVTAVVARESARRGESFGKSLNRMIYGILCFATLFSFVGTVLGGIWADQSWGRFWGWDVKENGALIIVLWNALVLHARWGGLVRERGLAGLAIAGNIVTSWSWFGVNMLGIGLHSYGFTSAAFQWLVGFVCSQLLLIALAMLPLRMWRSFQTAAAPDSGGAKGGSGKPAPAAA